MLPDNIENVNYLNGFFVKFAQAQAIIDIEIINKISTPIRDRMGIFNFVFRTFDEVRFKSWDVALLVPACCYKYKMRIINCAIEINAYLLAWKVAHVIPPPKQKKQYILRFCVKLTFYQRHPCNPS